MEGNRMQRWVGAGLLASIPLWMAVACSSSGDGGGSTGSDGGSSSGSSGSGDGGSDAGIIAPPGCDLKVDPKEPAAAPCLDDSVGVFVSPTGKDDSNGKKADPVKTLQQALKLVTSSRPRIYVCGDETQVYAGPVVLTGTDNVSIYGGFECSGWGHKGAKSKIAVTQGGDVALDVDKAKNASFQDLVIEGPAEGAPNSIAARVTDSNLVSFKRVKLIAGNGQSQGKAADGATLGIKSTNPPQDAGSPDYAGLGGDGTSGGKIKTCTCEDSSTTTGASGGGAGGVGGGNGEPDLGALTPPDGKGGAMGAPDCSTGLGHTGANGLEGAAGGVAAAQGTLDARAWRGAAGSVGKNGGPGQGGGGGSGRASGGGAGGCGGCGGSGGKGGAGGGGSIALLVVSSGLALEAVESKTAKGGNGGGGGGGGGGAIGGGGGGAGSAPNPLGCPGGDGGKGGKGGAGAGGAGGISVGIVYKGTKPTGADTINWTGDSGGEGGAEGDTGAGNAGPKGISEKLYEVK